MKCKVFYIDMEEEDGALILYMPVKRVCKEIEMGPMIFGMDRSKYEALDSPKVGDYVEYKDLFR